MPKPRTSTTPPSESPALAASLISRIISASASGSQHRTSELSIDSRSPGPGRRSGSATAPPNCTTWLSTDMSTWRNNTFASAPAATRAAISRALARSSTSRIGEPVLLHAGEVGVPRLRLRQRLLGGAGAADISRSTFPSPIRCCG
jgi:hypothetical protein